MDSIEQLARLTLQLVNAGALDATVKALNNGNLTRNAGSATRGSVASGRLGVEELLKALDTIWCAYPSSLDAHQLAQMLSSIAVGARVQSAGNPTTEVVWTGPTVKGSHLRATRQVVQDVIKGAKKKLLVVGYWLAGKGDDEGIINDVIEQIADAVKRGVAVTMVLDQREKAYGKNNRAILLELWPKGVRLPAILTWEIPKDEKHVKLHAKVLVADQSDALVTSANLTMHALDKNMEMGVRVSGDPAQNIAKHFDLLCQSQELVPFQ